MGYNYLGPVDGHNIHKLIDILEEAKNSDRPVLLHVHTKKGKGYEPAENDQTTWHAPGEFSVETGTHFTEEFTYNKKGQIERIDCYAYSESVEYKYDDKDKLSKMKR